MNLSGFRNLLLVLALLVGASLSGFVAWRWQALQDEGRLVEAMPEKLDLALTEIDYRHLEDGVTRWRLQAVQVARKTAGSGLKIQRPRLDFFNRQGELVGSLSAAAGEISETYRQVAVSGDVVLETVSGYTVYTDAMHYDHDHQRLSSPGQVAAVGNGMELTGRGLEIDLADRRLRLLAEVRAVFSAGQVGS